MQHEWKERHNCGEYHIPHAKWNFQIEVEKHNYSSFVFYAKSRHFYCFHSIIEMERFVLAKIQLINGKLRFLIVIL